MKKGRKRNIHNQKTDGNWAKKKYIYIYIYKNKAPKYPCSGKQCHTLFWIASYMYELDSLGPIQKSHCMEWSPKSFLFLLNCMYPYQKDPPQHCEASSHWGGPASKIQPKFFSDCSSKGRQIVQSFRVDNCQTFLCGSRLVRVKFSFESEREISYNNLFCQKMVRLIFTQR